MVRKDPLNERGPTPPGGREKPSVGLPIPNTLFELRPTHEYKRVWDVVISALDQNITFIQIYASLGLPDIPVEDLIELRDRIDQLIPERRDPNE